MCRISLRGGGVIFHVALSPFLKIPLNTPRPPPLEIDPTDFHQQPMATLASYLGFQTTLFTCWIIASIFVAFDRFLTAKENKDFR